MVLEKTNYVDKAEDVVSELVRDKEGKLLLTTTKIRSLLSMVSTIYNEVLHYPSDKLNEDIVGRLKYLKMRFAYEAGREDNNKKEKKNGKKIENPIRNLIRVAEIFETIEWIGDDKQRCILFCKYMESIVAYHKFYGGKD